MKKFLSLILALAMVLTMGIAAFAEDAAAPAVKQGEGPEKDRPNDSTQVIKYDDFYKRPYNFYEAEAAEVIDGAKVNADHDGYKGTGCVAITYWTATATTLPGIKFTVNAAVAGAQDIYIGYDNGHAFSQTANLLVNDTKVTKLTFPTVAKDIWAAYGMIKTNVTLNAGENTITIRYDKEDYPSSFNIDFVAVSKGDAWKDEATAIKLTIGDKAITKVTGNGEVKVDCDVAPMIKADLGLTFIPVRGVFDAAGADIAWNADTRAVTIKTEDSTVIVTVDNKQARVNGRRVMMDGAAFIEDSRTFIPLRFISENLGYKVDWNGDTQTITISLE